LVFVNREIATQAVPALRLTASTREAIAPLAWLEARALVLGDARYARAWTERAGQVSQDLRRLSEYAVSQWEALHLREASVAVESRDEIGALARSFNSMASQLRRMEETKAEFFASVSHELRSPLTSIHGSIELLRDGAPGPLTERQRRLTDIIGLSSERLLRLVNQILEMSRLRAGLVELDRGPLDFAWLVDRAVEEIHPQAEEAGVTLEHERFGSHFAHL